MPQKKFKLPLKRQTIILVILISFLVSAVVGFISGSAAFELSHYISENTYLQNLLPQDLRKNSQQDNLQKDENVKLPVTPQIQEAALAYEKQITQVIKEVSPAVVSVIVSKDVPVLEQYMEDPFEDFFGENSPFDFKIPQYRQNGTEKQEIGGGTGFVVGRDGLILTNKHVVEDQEADYTVFTNDGEKHEAQVITRDPLQDVAFLKVADLDIQPLKLGDSENLAIGQTVITIGNALGEFRNTVSVGVISGLRRNIVASSQLGRTEKLDQLIQTDAAINRGNSGGPLINIKGEVIGINTAMASGAENIGFAIPINITKKNISVIREQGKITYPYLGVRYILINEALQKQNNLSVDYGALIIRGSTATELAVMPGSPADKAGLRENDIILEVEKQKIDEDHNLTQLILEHNIEETITLKVLSKGETKEIQVTLAEKPGNL
jgi:serine protease Do